MSRNVQFEFAAHAFSELKRMFAHQEIDRKTYMTLHGSGQGFCGRTQSIQWKFANNSYNNAVTPATIRYSLPNNGEVRGPELHNTTWRLIVNSLSIDGKYYDFGRFYVYGFDDKHIYLRRTVG